MQMDGNWSLWAAPRFSQCHYRFLVAICVVSICVFSTRDSPSCFNGVWSEASYHLREQVTAIPCDIIG